MEKALEQFGLTKNEIKIYLLLLKLGSANPSEIAEESNLSRSYVYDALERLREKRMVSTILKKNKKNFTPIDPNHLKEIAKQRYEQVEKIIPSLIQMKSETKEEINVSLHSGKYVYKTLLD